MRTITRSHLVDARMTARRHHCRRGVASVLAMIYLVLISVLAVGFAEASALCAQMADNERDTELARAATRRP